MLGRGIICGLLVLAAAVGAVSLRSYGWDDVAIYQSSGQPFFVVGPYCGSVLVGTAMTRSKRYTSWWFYNEPTGKIARDEMHFGFTFVWESQRKMLGAPLWPISAALFLIAWRLRRPTAPGLCAQCGHDLRATPQGGADLLEVCPECGGKRTLNSE